MRKQGSWQRWFGASQSRRPASSRCIVRGVETLERRDLLSAVVGSAATNTIEPALLDAAVLADVGGASAKAGGGDTTTTPYTYESMKKQLWSWEGEYGLKSGKDLVKLFDIGDGAQAYEDPIPNDPHPETTRSLWAIKISDHASLADDGHRKSEPDAKYIGTMHGNEPLGMEMNMRLISELLANYGKDAGMTDLVNNNEIWVLPLMNPDGFANGTRANYNGYNLNRSFPELAPLDPYSTTKPDLATLESALPKDRNGDCAVPEVKAVMDWSAEHDFVLAANFHTGELLVNYPYDNDGTTTTPHPAVSPDDGTYRALANIYADNYNESSPSDMTIKNGAEWFVITGGMQDFDYRYFGTKHVTIELYSGYGYGTKKNPLDLKQQWDYNKPAMLAYLEEGIPLVIASGSKASSAPMAAMTQLAGVPTTTVQPPLSSSLLTAIHLSVSRQSAKMRQSLLLSDEATVRDWDWSPAAVDMVLEGA